MHLWQLQTAQKHTKNNGEKEHAILAQFTTLQHSSQVGATRYITEIYGVSCTSFRINMAVSTKNNMWQLQTGKMHLYWLYLFYCVV